MFHCIRLAILAIFGLSITFQCSYSFKMNGVRRHVARVAYDGGNFRGFQEQERSLRTVQQTLREVFSSRCNRLVNIFGASRTDAGVHAAGQVFHFYCEPVSDMPTFEFSINSMLPNDVKIFDTSVAPLDFDGNIMHARGSSRGKLYRYSFCSNRFLDPLRARYCGHVGRKLDLGVLNDSLQLYVGTHDFRAFGHGVDRTQIDYDTEGFGMQLETTRTINSIKLVELGDGYFNVDIHLHSALHKMVRNMIGTSWCVAGGMISLDEQKAYLTEGMDRLKNRGKTAPAEGLCLQKVYYDNY